MGELSRDNAKEISLSIFGTNELDKIVAILLDCKKNNQSVAVNFNGHKLYSCDVTLENAYIDVYGITKEEYDKNNNITQEDENVQNDETTQNADVDNSKKDEKDDSQDENKNDETKKEKQKNQSV